MTDRYTVAYLDCFAGISGDMLLGALIDAGLPIAVLEEQLASLALAGFSLSCRERQTGALRGTLLEIEINETGHPHRSLADILAILERSKLPEPTRRRATEVFRTLAEAEAKVHGCAVEAVHFHEVGGMDAIIDIVGAAIGIAHLGIDRLICSPLPMPRGWVSCAHGRLPLPAPAVCEILTGVPVYGTDFDRELVTPTGAALVKALCAGFGPMPPMVVGKVGYGCGKREQNNGQPNLLRLIIGQGQRVNEAQSVEVIETHLDDWSPEGFPYLAEQLFEAGALDVALIPIQMKKGRPGFLLRVIGDAAVAFGLKQLILTETTAIGLRFRSEQRLTLPRRGGWVETIYGRVRAKRIETPAGIHLTPEYEDCRRIAQARKIPLRAVYDVVRTTGPEDFNEDA
ncbi:MAG: nickel pincer cofactor biosynthesis protein LarC [Desulfobulbaceae bacterium]|nr:nickel pincer cofactor biosynthesis protein LarC [Desulfobulbaceae bacterium]